MCIYQKRYAQWSKKVLGLYFSEVSPGSSSSSSESDSSSSSSSSTNVVVGGITKNNEIVQMITKLGGNPKSYPLEKMDVLAPEVCQHLMTSTSSSSWKVDTTTSSSSSTLTTQQDITVDDLVEQIGLGTATELFDFFYESVGTTKFVIQRIYIVQQRSASSSSTDPEEVEQENNNTIGYHANDRDGNKWTLSVSLNDEYEGGELIYINSV